MTKETSCKYVYEVYDGTHGVTFEKMGLAPLGLCAADRIEFWRKFWCELGFDTPEPTGSSRLVEVALAIAAADGSPREILLGLSRCLKKSSIVTDSHEYFFRHIWVNARSSERFSSLFPFCDKLPTSLSPAQAYLIARFTCKNESWSGEQWMYLRSKIDPGRLEHVL